MISLYNKKLIVGYPNFSFILVLPTTCTLYHPFYAYFMNGSWMGCTGKVTVLDRRNCPILFNNTQFRLQPCSYCVVLPTGICFTWSLLNHILPIKLGAYHGSISTRALTSCSQFLYVTYSRGSIITHLFYNPPIAWAFHLTPAWILLSALVWHNTTARTQWWGVAYPACMVN